MVSSPAGKAYQSGVCEKVDSDLELGGGFCWVLQFAPTHAFVGNLIFIIIKVLICG